MRAIRSIARERGESLGSVISSLVRQPRRRWRTPDPAVGRQRLVALAWPNHIHHAAGPFDGVVGYRQITDAHLLTLALCRGGKLATFDASIPSLDAKEPEAVELIP